MALAASRRSKELTRVFRFCVENSLWVVAPANTRLQLDSALRLLALQLVDDGNHLAKYILDGNDLKKYRLQEHSPNFASKLTGSNRQLNDSFLYQKLSEVYSSSFKGLHSENKTSLHGHSDPDRFLDNPIGDIYQDGNKFIHLSQSHIMEMFDPDSLIGDANPALRSDETAITDDAALSWCVTMLFVTDVLRQQIHRLLAAESCVGE